MKKNNKITLSLLLILTLIVSLFLNVLTVSAEDNNQYNDRPVLTLDSGYNLIDPETKGINLSFKVDNGNFNAKKLYGVAFRVKSSQSVESVLLTIPDNQDWSVISGEPTPEGGIISYKGQDGYNSEDEIFVNAFITFTDNIPNNVTLDIIAENVYGTSNDGLVTYKQTFDTLNLRVGAGAISVVVDKISASKLTGHVSDNVTKVTVNEDEALLLGDHNFLIPDINIKQSEDDILKLRRIEIVATTNTNESKTIYKLIGNFCGVDGLADCNTANDLVDGTDLAYVTQNWEAVGGAGVVRFIKLNHGRHINPETGDVLIGSGPIVSSVVPDHSTVAGSENTEFHFNLEVKIMDDRMTDDPQDVVVTIINPNKEEIVVGTNITPDDKTNIYTYDFNNIEIPASKAVYGKYSIKVVATDYHHNITTSVVKGVLTYQEEVDELKAVDDTASTNINQSVNINVISNDTGANITINAITQDASNGECEINRHERPWTVLYTPNKDYIGDDQCVYQIIDNDGKTDNANIDIVVSGTPM